MTAASLHCPRPAHGGDLDAIAALFTRAPTPWIDLSTGINPWAYPLPAIDATAWTRLPSRAFEDEVRAKAAAFYGFGDAANVVLAPGSQALIQWLPRLRARSRVAVFGPTYAEHAWCWAQAGHEIALLDWEEEPPAQADVVVVVRPNNPDGRSYPLDRLAALADRLARRDGWLIVDEAFAEVAAGPSIAAVVTAPSLVVLRSFGKFFGLGGCRLGFAWAMPPLCDSLREALGPWCVPGPALAIAASALADATWIAATRRQLAEAATRLDGIAAAAGLRLLGGTSLFRLYEAADAPSCFASLAAAGILVRRFAERPSWLRFGLPASGLAEERLRSALALGAVHSSLRPDQAAAR